MAVLIEDRNNETDNFFASGRFFNAKGLLRLGGSETRPTFVGLKHPRRPNAHSHLDALATKAALAKIDISLKNYQFHSFNLGPASKAKKEL